MEEEKGKNNENHVYQTTTSTTTTSPAQWFEAQPSRVQALLFNFAKDESQKSTFQQYAKTSCAFDGNLEGLYLHCKLCVKIEATNQECLFSYTVCIL